MKRRILKTITALILSAAMLLLPPSGEFPLSLNHSAHAAATVRIGNKSYPADTEILDVRDMGLTDKDIKNIGSFTNLTEIIISDNKITDLSPVSKLTTLEKITFHNNFVSDISFAKNLRLLTVFGANDNPISDISALSGLKNLKEVWMQDTLVTDISPLKNCSKLTHVCFNGCALKNINALSGKKNLDTVCLASCGLKSIQPLEDCAHLRYVYINDNNLTDISALRKSINGINELYADVEYTEPAASSKPAASAPSVPTASKKSGTITCSGNSASIKLTADSGAAIYYSLNGGSYKKYSSAVKLTKNSTLEAYAEKGGKESAVVTYSYKLKPKVSFSAGSTDGQKTVKLSSGTDGVKLYYTTDGSKPTTDSRLYTSGGVTLTKSCKLRVLAVKSGWSDASFSKEYTVKSSSSNSGSSNNSSNSSSSSGTSTNSTSKLITTGTETRECKACYSFGNCIECNGMGTLSRYPLGTVDCDRCKGTGKCYICGGTKKISVKVNVVNEDAVPEGKEFRKCIQCGASGVCPYCNGGGVQFGTKCSMCKGTGICSSCDGSGGKLVDKPASSTDSSSSGSSSSGGSSSSSSSGGPSSGNVSVLQNLCPTCRGTLQCNYCHGLRHCLTCSGKGGTYTSTYGHGTKWTPCTACGGSKKCKKCLGTGKCETCGGKPWTPQ